MRNSTTSTPVVELLTTARQMGLIDGWRTTGPDILFQRGASSFLAPPTFTAVFLLRLMEQSGYRRSEIKREADGGMV